MSRTMSGVKYNPSEAPITHWPPLRKSRCETPGLPPILEMAVASSAPIIQGRGRFSHTARSAPAVAVIRPRKMREAFVMNGCCKKNSGAGRSFLPACNAGPKSDDARERARAVHNSINWQGLMPSDLLVYAKAAERWQPGRQESTG